MPIIKLNLTFKPMLDITQVGHYIKHKPEVYDHNNLYFDWSTTLYELNSHDRRFLSQINTQIEQGIIGSAANQVPLEERDLERVLDILEKIYFIKKELTDKVLMFNFEQRAEQSL